MPDLTVESTLTQVRFCGYGGQGIVLAGILLGKAASMYDGKEAVFTQSYGPEARGGASTANVVISNEPVDYPLITQADILVALFQEAYVRYRPTLRPGGLLIVESDLVEVQPEDAGCDMLPATRLAEELGSKIVANVVVLGYLVGRSGVVSREAAEKALAATVKPKTLELNKKAFAAGFDRGTQREA